MPRDQNSILPLTVQNLGFAVDGKVLVEDVSFTVQQGGIMAVIGPNGAGKSLLLRLCHGLIKPSSGSVKWANDKAKRQHGMVFQRPVMLRRSARSNLEHALAAHGVGRQARAQRVNAVLAQFGLGDLAEQPARQLSGGEQQRLAIARAWALNPDVIFLDEPCSQLDPGATRQVEAMLTTLVGEGVTLVLATHDLGQAKRLAKTVVFLNQGRLAESGASDMFFRAPQTVEASAFIKGELLW